MAMLSAYALNDSSIAFSAQRASREGAAAEYASFQDTQRREAWRRSLESQIINWRSRVIEAIGVSSTIGVAMGGAVVAVGGVAAGLAQPRSRC